MPCWGGLDRRGDFKYVLVGNLRDRLALGSSFPAVRRVSTSWKQASCLAMAHASVAEIAPGGGSQRQEFPDCLAVPESVGEGMGLLLRRSRLVEAPGAPKGERDFHWPFFAWAVFTSGLFSRSGY